MKTRNIIAALTCAYALVVSPFTFAETEANNSSTEATESSSSGWHHDWHSKWHNHFAALAKKLNLTEEQSKEIKGIHEDTEKALHQQYVQLKDIKKRINEEFKNNTITQEKIDAFYNEEKAVVDDMIKYILNERFNIFKLLTDEQKQKMSTSIEKWKQHHSK